MGHILGQMVYAFEVCSKKTPIRWVYFLGGRKMKGNSWFWSFTKIQRFFSTQGPRYDDTAFISHRKQADSQLGGGFKCFLFSPLVGEDVQFD